MDVPLGDMRRAILLILLLLIPPVIAGEDQEWTIEVEDQFGNPIPDCEITLTEPWTGNVIQQPNGGMYQPSATCDGYVVMWHEPIPATQTVAVLEAHSIIEDLFTVEGAHTVQALGSTWSIEVENGSVDAPNIPLVVIGDGGSQTRTGHSSITIPNATNTYVLNHSFPEGIGVSAIHTGSGQVVHMADGNLTVGEFGGGWTARVSQFGLPIGTPTWPPTNQWVWDQINHTLDSGEATIEFTSSLQPNSVINASWNANYRFNGGLGLAFIPGVEAGIQSQVDRFLDGDSANLEALIESMSMVNAKEILCCIIDDSHLSVSELEIDAFVDGDVWGWNESAELEGQRSHIYLVRMEIPFQNDLRQSTPLRVITNGEHQFVSSPIEDWIEGNPANFTIERDKTSIIGNYMVTLGPNEAPIVNLSEDYALPWENTSYDFIPIIEDAPLSIHDCVWDIGGLSDNIGVDLTAFTPDSNISVSVTCTDEGGLSDTIEKTLVLDDGMPWINASNEVQEIPPGLFTWDLMVGDDHDQNLRVYWTSNKSMDWWYTGDILDTTFHICSDLNSINDDEIERHQAKNQCEYWLSAEVSDDVGHSVIGNWTIRLADVNGPVVIGHPENSEGEDWRTGTIFRPDDIMRLNLSHSFDDHSAVEDLTFEITVAGQTTTDLTWEEAVNFPLPMMGVGYHTINVVGIDEQGNRGGQPIGLAIAPPIARNLEVTDITHESGEIEPGKNRFWITVQNNGASTTEFILCSGNECTESIVAPSTYNQNATAIVSLEVEMGWFDTFGVELSYLDDNNNTVVKNSVSQYSSGTSIGGFELIVGAIVAALVIIWFRQRNEARF